MALPHTSRIGGRRNLLRLAALLGAAVLVDLLLAVVYLHLPDGELVKTLAPAFPVSYQNWVMWAAFIPVVLWLVRAMTASRWPWGRRMVLSLGLAVGLASAHSVIEMWLHRVEGLHHVVSAGFFSYHFFHGLLTYSVVFAVALLMESDRAARDRERRELQLQEQVTRAQLHTLRIQLQPHFMFNTLNSISALVEQDVRGGQRMIGHLSDFLRLTLTSAERHEIPLREELHLLNAYVEIQRVRFQERLRVEYEIEEQALDALVPSLILQPLLENAIKHGIQPLVDGGTVTVRGYREADWLVLEVADDGAGLDAARGPEAGVGLKNTLERLRQCYGDAAEMDVVRRAPSGTAVVQRLPWSTWTSPVAVAVQA